MFETYKKSKIAQNQQTLTEKEVYSYPNPSKGVTTIRFPLASQQEVRIAILDINGRQVWSRDLGTQDTTAGVNRIVWNGINDSGRQVANGVYLFIIQADNKTVKKKIAIVR